MISKYCEFNFDNSMYESMYLNLFADIKSWQSDYSFGEPFAVSIHLLLLKMDCRCLKMNGWLLKTAHRVLKSYNVRECGPGISC